MSLYSALSQHNQGGLPCSRGPENKRASRKQTSEDDDDDALPPPPRRKYADGTDNVPPMSRRVVPLDRSSPQVLHENRAREAAPVQTAAPHVVDEPELLLVQGDPVCSRTDEPEAVLQAVPVEPTAVQYAQPQTAVPVYQYPPMVPVAYMGPPQGSSGHHYDYSQFQTPVVMASPYQNVHLTAPNLYDGYSSGAQAFVHPHGYLPEHNVPVLPTNVAQPAWQPHRPQQVSVNGGHQAASPTMCAVAPQVIASRPAVRIATSQQQQGSNASVQSHFSDNSGSVSSQPHNTTGASPTAESAFCSAQSVSSNNSQQSSSSSYAQVRRVTLPSSSSSSTSSSGNGAAKVTGVRVHRHSAPTISTTSQTKKTSATEVTKIPAPTAATVKTTTTTRVPASPPTKTTYHTRIPSPGGTTTTTTQRIPATKTTTTQRIPAKKATTTTVRVEKKPSPVGQPAKTSYTTTTHKIPAPPLASSTTTTVKIPASRPTVTFQEPTKLQTSTSTVTDSDDYDSSDSDDLSVDETIASIHAKGCCNICDKHVAGKHPCMTCGRKHCKSCMQSSLSRITCRKCAPDIPTIDITLDRSCVNCNNKRGTTACVVCGDCYCKCCIRDGFGDDRPEGDKCQACLGELPHQALLPVDCQLVGKVLKTVHPKSVLVNDEYLTKVQLWTLLCEKGVAKFLRAGSWWYDRKSGWMGPRGSGPKSTIRAGLELGGSELEISCSGGSCGIVLNGREITGAEQRKFLAVGCGFTTGEWFYHDNGDYGPMEEDGTEGPIEGNYGQKCRDRAMGVAKACGKFALEMAVNSLSS